MIVHLSYFRWRVLCTHAYPPCRKPHFARPTSTRKQKTAAENLFPMHISKLFFFLANMTSRRNRDVGECVCDETKQWSSLSNIAEKFHFDNRSVTGLWDTTLFSPAHH